MTLPSPFALPHSQFNEFLFALIGMERNGMPLSVISALARLEVDPWQEAARLADLPKELAATALDGLIRRLPGGRKKAGPSAIVWLIVVALGAAVLIGTLADGAQRWNKPGASAGLTNGVQSSAQP